WYCKPGSKKTDRGPAGCRQRRQVLDFDQVFVWPVLPRPCFLLLELCYDRERSTGERTCLREERQADRLGGRDRRPDAAQGHLLVRRHPGRVRPPVRPA